jgi:sulfur carrier protein
MTTTTIRLREITVNGTAVATASDTLAAFVAEQGFGGVKVATAVNGDFVAERRRADTALTDGDHVEILSVRQGG